MGDHELDANWIMRFPPVVLLLLLLWGMCDCRLPGVVSQACWRCFTSFTETGRSCQGASVDACYYAPGHGLKVIYSFRICCCLMLVLQARAATCVTCAQTEYYVWIYLREVQTCLAARSEWGPLWVTGQRCAEEESQHSSHAPLKLQLLTSINVFAGETPAQGCCYSDDIVSLIACEMCLLFMLFSEIKLIITISDNKLIIF